MAMSGWVAGLTTAATLIACLAGGVTPARSLPDGRVSLEEFGAVPNDGRDDTVALQKAFDALRPGQTLTIPAGDTFEHSAVLRLHSPNSTITGGGTLVATDESQSEVFIDADGVTLSNVTLRMHHTSRRWDAYEQMKLRVGPHEGVSVINVTVKGSAAAGVYVGGASHFLLKGLRVLGTRADGIHITEGSHDGRVEGAHIARSGDDGIAVVSYLDQQRCARIAVVQSTVSRQVWGRAFSVVGGQDIAFASIHSYRSAAAAFYVAAESEYKTHGVNGVTLENARFDRSNQSRIDHGAIVIYDSQEQYKVEHVTIRNVDINRTSRQASTDVKVRNEGAGIGVVRLNRVTIRGGPTTPIWENEGPAYATVSMVAVTKNGQPILT